ncbi:MAG: NADH:ubiquinone reductase (Na(+)-transporting) subunit B [Rhodobacterales bacterium]|nr:NADH:ubiquinone reductase (Na(+)-transporting) subunit B [Rhodobacterales bacterium]
MRDSIERLFDSLRPNFEKDGKLEYFYPAFEGMETALLTVGHRTQADAHVRDPLDMKRMMIFVLYALIPCILMGWYNAGNQAYLSEGVQAAPLDALIRGGWAMLPTILMSYTAGGIAELIFCFVRKHEINEGFLVTAMLFPLTLPPTIPLWMTGAGIIFGVVIGKEVFGGVGMNILNPALTARAFVFFTYPAYISGAKVWDAGGSDIFATPDALVDGYTGATPLLAAASAPAGSDPVAAITAAGWSFKDLVLGLHPGSMGETSTVVIAIGAAFLIFVGIASWRTMVGGVVGLLATTFLFNMIAGPESNPMMLLPPHYHLVMGSFAFGIVFMATDPVSSSATPVGKIIYGFFIGVLCALIRVVNPAYPEGMMLAILFMNVFAPLIDYVIVKRSTARRAKRLAAV